MLIDFALRVFQPSFPAPNRQAVAQPAGTMRVYRDRNKTAATCYFSTGDGLQRPDRPSSATLILTFERIPRTCGSMNSSLQPGKCEARSRGPDFEVHSKRCPSQLPGCAAHLKDPVFCSLEANGRRSEAWHSEQIGPTESELVQMYCFRAAVRGFNGTPAEPGVDCRHGVVHRCATAFRPASTLRLRNILNCGCATF
jgi:hypothetical protein